eukprot:6012586-Alexandrium_andersonii.AAC.1
MLPGPGHRDSGVDARESRNRASDRRLDTECSADRRPGAVAQRVAGGSRELTAIRAPKSPSWRR